ncbi:hypothetical protein [Gracilibacillus alcaliphilus]|nr:hypothetical protein [Gracilibacillus alcaliphilus]MBM7675919.1 hypothetical protein [Gracilibacillus alcaliphilus]
MQRTHGIGYAEYCRKLDQRMEVEKEREASYRQGKHVVEDIQGLVHR